MGGDAATGFVGYPMVEEAEATGVYAGLLESMPFVPSLFKSLALCPGYLVLAHEQAAPVLPDPSFGSAAQQLVASVWNVATPPTDAEVREALAQFAGPLSRMLLLAVGLRLALDGELNVPPAPGRPPAARPVEPESPAPSPADAPAARRYGEIRAGLDTPVVNSVWRVLAGRGLLDAAWAVLGPQGDRHPAGRRRPSGQGLRRRTTAALAGRRHPGGARPDGTERCPPGHGRRPRRLRRHPSAGARARGRQYRRRLTSTPSLLTPGSCR